jgi:hypothetical protein
MSACIRCPRLLANRPIEVFIFCLFASLGAFWGSFWLLVACPCLVAWLVAYRLMVFENVYRKGA